MIPTDPAQFCAHLRKMDERYNTDPDTPLHHDNRWCPVHGQPKR